MALIEPTVICTLGNFSTKLLRGDPTGISRLHGRDEVQVIGERAVRLYPLYHPAAALYTPSMLATLRTDFERIPALLALGAPRAAGSPSEALEVPELEMPEASRGARRRAGRVVRAEPAPSRPRRPRCSSACSESSARLRPRVCEPAPMSVDDAVSRGLRGNRDFTLLWVGDTLSQVGSQATTIAMPLLVLFLTGSAADAGLVGFARAIGYPLTALPGGRAG